MTTPAIRYFLMNEMPPASLGPNGVKQQNNLTFYGNKLNTGVPVVVAAKPSRTDVSPGRLRDIAPHGFARKLGKNLVSLWADDGSGPPVRLNAKDLEVIVREAAEAAA